MVSVWFSYSLRPLGSRAQAHEGSMWASAWAFQEQAINIRPSYIDECSMMVKYLTEDMAFTKISMFYQDDDYGEAGLEGTDIGLRAHGFTIHSQGKFKYLYGTGEEDVETGLNAIGNAGDPEESVALSPTKR